MRRGPPPAHRHASAHDQCLVSLAQFRSHSAYVYSTANGAGMRGSPGRSGRIGQGQGRTASSLCPLRALPRPNGKMHKWHLYTVKGTPAAHPGFKTKCHFCF